MATDDDWLARIAGIRRWSRGGVRAPHKPLLLLYALGQLQQSGNNLPIAFAQAEAPLDRLLVEYGPPHKTSSAYPFLHLANDGLWELSTTNDQTVADRSSSLKKAGAVGQLEEAFANALLADPNLLVRSSRLLLDTEFPESLHRAIAADVGLDLEVGDLAVATPMKKQRRRSAAFRADVLVAYEYRCAMCGYEGRVGGEAVGLEAAHVRWWAFDGPDELANGMALCTMHHLLFDRGVLGIDEAGRVNVSRSFVGHDRSSSSLVLSLLGRDVGRPQSGLPGVEDNHLAWHRTQVFRSPGRSFEAFEV